MREENEKLITVRNLQKALKDYDEIKGTAVVECEELPEKTENRTYKVHGEKDSVFVKDTEIATEEALLEEKARATEAENALTESLNAEKTRATEAEAKLNESISEEKARAKEAETTLSEAVTKETDRATEAENELKEAIVNKNDAIQEEFSDSKIDDYSSIYIAELDRAESSLEKITSLLKKPVVNFWNYIRNKIDSDLGIRLKSDTLEVDGSTTLVRVPGSITEKWTTQDFQGGNGTQFGGGSITVEGFTHGLYIDASEDGAKWAERSGNEWSVQVNAGVRVYIPATDAQEERSISVDLYPGTEIEADTGIHIIGNKTYVTFIVTKSGYLKEIRYTHTSDSQIKADMDGVKVLKDLSVGEKLETKGNITEKGKRVVTSVNGTQADANGNVTISTGGGFGDWELLGKYYDGNEFANFDDIDGTELLFVYIEDDDPEYVNEFVKIEKEFFYNTLMFNWKKILVLNFGVLIYDHAEDIWYWEGLGDGYMKVYFR